jgi:hypothetical protein
MKISKVVVVFLFLGGSLAAQPRAVPDVVPPAKRQASIALAEKLSTLNTTPGAIATPERVINPFDPSASQPAAPTARPTSDNELLALLSSQMNPTGTAVLGGEPYLLFGQKRIKVGEKLPISFENVTYELEVTAIERTTFTVRYKTAELSRPVAISSSNKPGKNP